MEVLVGVEVLVGGVGPGWRWWSAVEVEVLVRGGGVGRGVEVVEVLFLLSEAVLRPAGKEQARWTVCFSYSGDPSIDLSTRSDGNVLFILATDEGVTLGTTRQ